MEGVEFDSLTAVCVNINLTQLPQNSRVLDEFEISVQQESLSMSTFMI